MAGPTADALRDALDGLSNRLDPLINALPPGDPTRMKLEGAQNSLEDASSDVAAKSIEAQLTDNADLQKIKGLTAAINANAAAIAASQQNVANIVSVADKALAVGTAISGGNVVTILSAVNALRNAL
jgi:hypothetical protein